MYVPAAVGVNGAEAAVEPGAPPASATVDVNAAVFEQFGSFGPYALNVTFPVGANPFEALIVGYGAPPLFPGWNAVGWTEAWSMSGVPSVTGGFGPTSLMSVAIPG